MAQTNQTTAADKALQEMAEKLAAAAREIEALKAAKAMGSGKITLKISTKGAVSVYGLGRWPVTLYAGQFERFLAFLGAPASNPVAAFIAANKDKVARKE